MVRVVVEIFTEPLGQDEDHQIAKSTSYEDHFRNELTEDVQSLVEISDQHETWTKTLLITTKIAIGKEQMFDRFYAPSPPVVEER